MSRAEFYLLDLKSKFTKIENLGYFYVIVPYDDDMISKFFVWFINTYLKENDFSLWSYLFANVIRSKKCKNWRNARKIYLDKRCNSCFDEDKNFYPLHDLTDDLLLEIYKEFEI